jgi:hypothetical protein
MTFTCQIHAMHRSSFTLFFSHCTPPSLLLFSDARAAISWLALQTPPPRAPGASRPPSFARIRQLQRRFSFCFCGSRDEIRLDLHRTFVPLLPPFLPLYCETNCCGQLRRAPGLLHAAGADLVGARASAVNAFPESLPLLCTNAPAATPCAILFSGTAKVSTLSLVCFSCTGSCRVPLFFCFTVSLLLTLFLHVC